VTPVFVNVAAEDIVWSDVENLSSVFRLKFSEYGQLDTCQEIRARRSSQKHRVIRVVNLREGLSLDRVEFVSVIHFGIQLLCLFELQILHYLGVQVFEFCRCDELLREQQVLERDWETGL